MEWISFLAGAFLGAAGLYLRYQSRRDHYRSLLFKAKIDCYHNVITAVDQCIDSIHQFHLFASVATTNITHDRDLSAVWETMSKVGEATQSAGISTPQAGTSDLASTHGIWARKYIPQHLYSRVDQNSVKYVQSLFDRTKELHQSIKDSHKLLRNAARESRLVLSPDSLKLIDVAFQSISTTYQNISSFYDLGSINDGDLLLCHDSLIEVSKHLTEAARREIGVDALHDEILQDLLAAKKSLLHNRISTDV